MTLKELIFFLAIINCSPMVIFSQTQLGTDLIGESFEDQFGTTVALSDDGTVVAVASIRNSQAAANAGHVRVYEWIDENWKQLGKDIDGLNPRDYLGNSVALSANGLVIACGAPGNGARKGYVVIREWNGTSWIPKGEILEGISVGEKFGTAVTLSADGNRIAGGAVHNDESGNNAGQVRIYDWVDNQWVQLGSPINGAIDGDNAGEAISMSADGSRIAIGSPDNDETDTKAGQVRVFEWSELDGWIQIGSALNGEGTRDESGSKIVLSKDGNRLAIGAPFNDGNGNWSGHVRVYEWQTNDWVQLGNDIDGEDEFDRSGFSLDMGSNGNRLIIGALNNGDNGTQAGHARVFEWKNNEWIQFGEDVDGDKAQDLLGFSVALSENGQVIVVGAPINGNAFVENAGYARVLSLSNELSTSVSSNMELEIMQVYPNPVDNIIYVDFKTPNTEKAIIEIYHSNGQRLSQKIVATDQLTPLDVSVLPRGFFTIAAKGTHFSQVVKMVKL